MSDFPIPRRFDRTLLSLLLESAVFDLEDTHDYDRNPIDLRRADLPHPVPRAGVRTRGRARASDDADPRGRSRGARGGPEAAPTRPPRALPPAHVRDRRRTAVAFCRGPGVRHGHLPGTGHRLRKGPWAGRGGGERLSGSDAPGVPPPFDLRLRARSRSVPAAPLGARRDPLSLRRDPGARPGRSTSQSGPPRGDRPRTAAARPRTGSPGAALPGASDR